MSSMLGSVTGVLSMEALLTAVGVGNSSVVPLAAALRFGVGEEVRTGLSLLLREILGLGRRTSEYILRSTNKNTGKIRERQGGSPPHTHTHTPWVFAVG